MEKACTKCGVIKPLADFYRHGQMGDGHLSACKECTKAAVRANRAANAERYRAYDRVRNVDPMRRAARELYQDSEAGKAASQRARRGWETKNAHKRAAQLALSGSGIPREPCVVCGSRDVEGHHFDYSRPLDVIWLCPHHHSAFHKIEREINRAKEKAA